MKRLSAVPITDPLKKAIAQKHRLYMKIRFVENVAPEMLPVLLNVENVGAKTCGGRSENSFVDLDFIP